jgi:hypothetical protein
MFGDFFFELLAQRRFMIASESSDFSAAIFGFSGVVGSRI